MLLVMHVDRLAAQGLLAADSHPDVIAIRNALNSE
jgi:hypothetical protein